MEAATFSSVPSMPAISMFYGIVIRMYFFDTKQHAMPHIHVQYADLRRCFPLQMGRLLPASCQNGKLAWFRHGLS